MGMDTLLREYNRVKNQSEKQPQQEVVATVEKRDNNIIN